ncbi:MAG TPA: amidohydrolase family protein, partial [Candidatus Sulfotelmatobacter sp.]
MRLVKHSSSPTCSASRPSRFHLASDGARPQCCLIRTSQWNPLAEMSNRLRQAVAKAKPSETVFTTVGWRIPDGRPNRQDLDQISMNVPIVAVRGRRGAMTLNSAALKAAGITREHATFEGIRVPTDSAGEPTGEGADYPQAMLLLDKLIPPPSQEEEVELIIRGQREQNSLGLTSMRELTLWPQAMRAYSEVWRQGKLSLRVSMQMDLPFEDRTVADLSKWGVGPGFGDHWLRLDSIGEEPYAPKTPLKQFTDIAIAVNRLGWRFALSRQRRCSRECQRDIY